MPKKVKNQPDEVTLAREEQAFDLRSKGWTQQRIAKFMNLTQPAICQILTRVTKKYSKLFMEEVKTVKAEQVAIHQRIVDESLDAWHKSKGLHEIKKNKAKGIFNKLGNRELVGGDTTIEEKQLFGDTRYLDASMKAMEHIRKIMGVGTDEENAPKDPIFNRVAIEVIDKRTLELENAVTDNA